VGAALALPLLDAMVPAITAQETAYRQAITPLAANKTKELSHVKSLFGPSLGKSPSFNPTCRAL
jgi:hypothetical protein